MGDIVVGVCLGDGVYHAYSVGGGGDRVDGVGEGVDHVDGVGGGGDDVMQAGSRQCGTVHGRS